MALTELLLALILMGIIMMGATQNYIDELAQMTMMQKKVSLDKVVDAIDELSLALKDYYKKNLDEYQSNEVSLLPFVYKDKICYKAISNSAQNIIKAYLKDVALVENVDSYTCAFIPELKIKKITYYYRDGESIDANTLVNRKSLVYLGESTAERHLSVENVPVSMKIEADFHGIKIKSKKVLSLLPSMIKETKDKIDFIAALVANYDASRYSSELLNTYPSGLPAEKDVFVPWACQIVASAPNSNCINTGGVCSNLGWRTSASLFDVRMALIREYNLDPSVFVSGFLNNIDVYLNAPGINLVNVFSSFTNVPVPNENYPSNILRYGVVVDDSQACKQDDTYEGICRKEIFYER